MSTNSSCTTLICMYCMHSGTSAIIKINSSWPSGLTAAGGAIKLQKSHNDLPLERLGIMLLCSASLDDYPLYLWRVSLLCASPNHYSHCKCNCALYTFLYSAPSADGAQLFRLFQKNFGCFKRLPCGCSVFRGCRTACVLCIRVSTW